MRALPQIDLTTPMKRRESARIAAVLIERRDQLRIWAARYPLFIMVADRQHVTESVDDLDSLIVGIELQLAEYRARM
jgi:hypothetical protein